MRLLLLTCFVALSTGAVIPETLEDSIAASESRRFMFGEFPGGETIENTNDATDNSSSTSNTNATTVDVSSTSNTNATTVDVSSTDATPLHVTVSPSSTDFWMDFAKQLANLGLHFAQSAVHSGEQALHHINDNNKRSDDTTDLSSGDPSTQEYWINFAKQLANVGLQFAQTAVHKGEEALQHAVDSNKRRDTTDLSSGDPSTQEYWINFAKQLANVGLQFAQTAVHKGEEALQHAVDSNKRSGDTDPSTQEYWINFAKQLANVGLQFAQIAVNKGEEALQHAVDSNKRSNDIPHPTVDPSSSTFWLDLAKQLGQLALHFAQSAEHDGENALAHASNSTTRSVDGAAPVDLASPHFWMDYLKQLAQLGLDFAQKAEHSGEQALSHAAGSA